MSRRLRAEESVAVARPARPTTALPGSPEKIAELARRVRKRQQLHVAGDRVDKDKRDFLGLLTMAGAIAAPLLAAPEVLAETPDLAGRIRRNVSQLPREHAHAAVLEDPEEKGQICNGPTVAGRLRQTRLQQGLSIHAVAMRAGMPSSTVLRIERGMHSPTLSTLRSLADVLGVRLDWLCCLERVAGKVCCLCA